MYVDAAMQALVDRVVPEAERSTWKPALDGRLEALEQAAGRPLPDFYRWFLGLAGGAFPHPRFGHARQDLRADTVLHAYRTGVVEPDPRYLLIGRIPDPVQPELVFYDLDTRARDDAMVCNRPEGGPPMRRRFETLREKIAWGLVRKHRVATSSQRCSGTLVATDGEVADELRPVLGALGFASPIETGTYCALYERDDATLAALRTIDDAPDGVLYFDFGGPDAGRMRRILGELRTNTSLEVEIDRWQPELP